MATFIYPQNAKVVHFQWSRITASLPDNPINSTATMRAFIAAKELRLVADNFSSPPAKSDTPRNTIQGTPFDRDVCIETNNAKYNF